MEEIPRFIIIYLVDTGSALYGHWEVRQQSAGNRRQQSSQRLEVLAFLQMAYYPRKYFLSTNFMGSVVKLCTLELWG